MPSSLYRHTKQISHSQALVLNPGFVIGLEAQGVNSSVTYLASYPFPGVKVVRA
jgi:hypothetical protein